MERLASRDRGAGGGGQSAVFSRPWYQAGLTLAGKAAPYLTWRWRQTSIPPSLCTAQSTAPSMVGNGCRYQRGITTVCWRAALADEAAAQHHEAPLGLANPLIYRLGQAHSTALRGITIGNNDVYGLGCCQAGPGYSEASGWGPGRPGADLGRRPGR